MCVLLTSGARGWHTLVMSIKVTKIDEDLYVCVESRRVTEQERRIFELPKTAKITNVWLEADLDGDWRAAFRLIPYQGEPVVGEIRIFPADEWSDRRPGQWRASAVGIRAPEFDRRSDGATTFPFIGQGVSAGLLRYPSFTLVRRYVRQFREFIRDHTKDDITYVEIFPGSREIASDAIDAGFSYGPLRRGRADVDWTPLRYAQIAAAYVKRYEKGSRKPTAEVAELFNLKDTQARDAIYKARYKLGLLTRAPNRGRPGGRLTAEAERILLEAQKHSEESNNG